MSKVAVVYWSGTGNTEAMASAIAESAKSVGAEVSLIECNEFSAEAMDSYNRIAFGCPSMGAEQLEESEFEPMFQECVPKLEGKEIALFGSYGWGGGEWMNEWEETCRSNGAVLVSESVICNDAPEQDTLNRCIELGETLAK